MTTEYRNYMRDKLEIEVQSRRLPSVNVEQPGDVGRIDICIIVRNFFRMKVQMLLIVQYCYLDYSRPVTGLSLARALCRERPAYVRQLIYAVLLALRISLCPLRRAGSLAICLSFHSSQTMLTPPSDEKLTRPAFDLKRADSDGHIILYVLKYFLDSDTYRFPWSKGNQILLSRSFDIFCQTKGIIAAKGLSSPPTTLTGAWFNFLRWQTAIHGRSVRKRATGNFFARSSRNPRTLKNAFARARRWRTSRHGIRIIIPAFVYAFSFLKHAYHTRVPNRHAARALRESMTSRPAFTDWLAVLRVWCTTARMSSTDGSLSPSWSFRIASLPFSDLREIVRRCNI